jgi:hypothetical protein
VLLLLLLLQYALPGSAGTFIDVTTDEDLQDMVRAATQPHSRQGWILCCCMPLNSSCMAPYRMLCGSAQNWICRTSRLFEINTLGSAAEVVLSQEYS